MKQTKDIIIEVGIFILVLGILIFATLLILNEFNSGYKECKNQPDDYVVKDYHWNNITCGELKAVNTSISSNEVAT